MKDMVLPSAKINDSDEYIHLAVNILDGNSFYSGGLEKTTDYRLFSKRTYGYPLFLQCNFIHKIPIYLAQSLLVLLCFFIGLSIIRRFNAQSITPVVYSIVFMSSIALFLHIGFALSDLLLTALVSLIAVSVYDKSDVNWLVIGLLWGATLFVKPVILPSIILVPFIFFYVKRKFSSWKLVLWTPVIVFLITCTFQYFNSGVFEYSSISTINLSQYNAKLTISKAYGYDSAQQFSNDLITQIPATEEEYESFKTEVSEKAIAVISDNFWSYLEVHTLGIVKMILDSGRFELFTFFGENTSEISLTELIFAGDIQALKRAIEKNTALYITYLLLFVIRLFVLIGFVVSLWQWKKYWFFFFLIAYFLVITGPVGAARFFLPVSVIFACLSAVGWESVFGKIQKRSLN